MCPMPLCQPQQLHWCCWDWSSSAGAHHAEGTSHCAHQKSKGDNATFCMEGNPVKVNESESWEAQAARMMCISLVYAGVSWKKPVLLLGKMAFASCHSLPLVLWAVPSFALVSFLWKLLPLPSSRFLTSTQNQRMWSGHPVYSPAPTWEERASVYL